MKNLAKNFSAILLILLAAALLLSFFSSPFKKTNEISFSQLINEINQDKVAKITVSGNDLTIGYKNELNQPEAKSIKEPEVSLSQSLLNYGISKDQLQKIEIDTKKEGGTWTWLAPLLIYLLPTAVLIFLFFSLFRQAKTGAMQAFDFTKARARLFGAEGHPKAKITFNDVAGLKEAKEELKEIVDFLKFPKKYLGMGAKIPRGVLLVGSAGVGKTMLARAVAGEANVPFLSISGSEFVEMFVGVGASTSKDTPILIRTKNFTELLPIGEFIDQFYSQNEEGLKKISDVQTLGANFSRGKKFFESSDWKKIKAVYRHSVNEIYEIQFLDGKIEVTDDHSIFIREKNRIIPKKANELKPGDILVNLPFKVRSVFVPGLGTTHKVKSHSFPVTSELKELTVWEENKDIYENYQFALENWGIMPQHQIAQKLGVSQMTISLWQRNLTFPRAISIKACPSKSNLPQKIKITPGLMKLLGYYTAEGRKTDYFTQFIFGSHEATLHQDCINLMQKIFNLKPHLEQTEDNSLRITYHSKFLGEFFEKHCGNGSHHKHIPEFLWDLPKEYFLSYLNGTTKGDGYTTKEGKLSLSSVSKQLISELAWLCAMHGIQVGITKTKTKEGRIIRNKVLTSSPYSVLIIGKTSHPFENNQKISYQFKKPKIKKIIKKPYRGYVYDLCGCDNEAFFGGEKPILLHNSRVRDLFSTAKKIAPSIIFMDELDAIGRHRGAGLGGGHDEREQTLNQILVEMDGFEKETGVIILAATNRPDILDPALLRPGRFDRKVVLDPPDAHDREAILKIHSKGKPLAPNINFREIAERTPGFSGADLANVANEAALLAARRNKKQIFQGEFLESIEKVLLGPERKSHILSKKEKEIAAYHEAGHALVSAYLPGTEPVRKISIIARGMAAGYTLQVPNGDKKMKTQTAFLSEVATLLGGYCAEKLKFNEITTGASSDLIKASDIARRLVKEYGMSPLGPISFGEKEELVFLGKEISEQRNYSEKVAARIDREVESIIKTAEKKANQVLAKKERTLDKIARTLIEKETIEREEFESLIHESRKQAPKTKAKRSQSPSLKVRIKGV